MLTSMKEPNPRYHSNTTNNMATKKKEQKTTAQIIAEQSPEVNEMKHLINEYKELSDQLLFAIDLLEEQIEIERNIKTYQSKLEKFNDIPKTLDETIRGIKDYKDLSILWSRLHETSIQYNSVRQQANNRIHYIQMKTEEFEPLVKDLPF